MYCDMNQVGVPSMATIIAIELYQLIIHIMVMALPSHRKCLFGGEFPRTMTIFVPCLPICSPVIFSFLVNRIKLRISSLESY